MLTRRALLAGLLALSACGGRGQAEPYQTALTEPWSAMNLPVGEGRVIYSDERMLNVHVDGGDRAALTAAWSAALEGAGYTRGTDSSGADMSSVTWNSEQAVVALGVIATEQRVEVSLTRYPRS